MIFWRISHLLLIDYIFFKMAARTWLQTQITSNKVLGEGDREDENDLRLMARSSSSAHYLITYPILDHCKWKYSL